MLREIEELDTKFESIKEVKKSKVLHTIRKMTYSVSDLTREEIALFVKNSRQ